MRCSAIGFGCGKKDLEAANCVRAMLGETQDMTDMIANLSCNIDDMTAEALGFAMERLFDAGALEVYTVPVGMKKSRPGVILRVFCRPQDRETIVRTIFRHTTTIGVRESMERRYVLERSLQTLDSPCGPIRRKTSSGYGITRVKYEFEDLARIARERDISLSEAEKVIEKSNCDE